LVGLTRPRRAHDGLVRDWKRLRHWVEGERAFLEWRTHLRGALDLWKTGKGTRLRGAALVTAVNWAQDRGSALSEEERVFIAGSEKSRGRVQRGLIAAGITLVVTLAALTTFAVRRSNLADRERHTATVERQVAVEAMTAAQQSNTVLRDSIRELERVVSQGPSRKTAAQQQESERALEEIKRKTESLGANLE
jgi:hypothetical protein